MGKQARGVGVAWVEGGVIGVSAVAEGIASGDIVAGEVSCIGGVELPVTMV